MPGGTHKQYFLIPDVQNARYFVLHIITAYLGGLLGKVRFASHVFNTLR